MSEFDNRLKYSLEECLQITSLPSNAIEHIIDNEDGTYSVMYHIVCEHCDYCDSQGPVFDVMPEIFPIAKENPYENSEADWWYCENFRYAFPGMIFGDDKLTTTSWSHL